MIQEFLPAGDGRATSASSWSTARRSAPSTACRVGDDIRSNMVRGGAREGHRPDAARARDLRSHRPGTQAARPDLRRHRRDRRPSDRNQRDFADRLARHQALGGPDLAVAIWDAIERKRGAAAARRARSDAGRRRATVRRRAAACPAKGRSRRRRSWSAICEASARAAPTGASFASRRSKSSASASKPRARRPAQRARKRRQRPRLRRAISEIEDELIRALHRALRRKCWPPAAAAAA